MATVEVVPGVCGFNTRIVTHADEMMNVTIEITSDCSRIRKLAENLREVSALDEVMQPINETATYRTAAQCRAHAACPVPSAILKAVAVAAGLALPADVQLVIRKD